MSDPKEIPLKDFHAKQGARFVNFGGWNMPVQYTSILEEHQAVREAVGLFDVSHMGEFHVEGPEATDFLDRLVVNRIDNASEGRAIYSPMCTDDGTVVDDLIVYKISETEYLVCVNAGNIEKDLNWFLEKAEAWKLDVKIEDHSSQFALLAVQGPLAVQTLLDAGLKGIDEMKRFTHQLTTFEGMDLRICRTGYTGEDGYEIYVHPDAAEQLAQLVLDSGEKHGLKLCGLGARDSLRLEAGLPLYGHEISDAITPLEAGLSWTVKFKKPDFVGREALAKQKEAGLTQHVIHFKLEGRRIAREGTSIIDEAGKAVGRVLSGTLSPLMGQPIGSALIESSAMDAPLYVDLRGNQQELIVAKPPLHK